MVALGNRYEKRDGVGLSGDVCLVSGSTLNDSSDPSIPCFAFLSLHIGYSHYMLPWMSLASFNCHQECRCSTVGMTTTSTTPKVLMQ